MGARYSRQTGYTMLKRPASRPTIRTVQRRVRFGPTTAKFIGLAVLAILAGLMLTQSGKRATDAYQQNQLRNQTSQVDQDIERLQLEARRLQTVPAISNTPVKNDMTPITKDPVNFVQTGDVAGASTTKNP